MSDMSSSDSFWASSGIKNTLPAVLSRMLQSPKIAETGVFMRLTYMILLRLIIRLCLNIIPPEIIILFSDTSVSLFFI